MANSIRNLLTIYGPPDEADRFVGRFARNGMEAFVPIPVTANPAQKYTETWGASPERGDFEVLTSTSIVAGQLADGDRPHLGPQELQWLNYNNFGIADQQDEIRSWGLPGFLGQGMRPLAVIVFCTKWDFPARWIEHVINAEYEHGVILHMQSYDLQSLDVGGGKVYHSYTANSSVNIQSGHCAICIHEAETRVAAERDGYWGETTPTRTQPHSDQTE